jgi:transcriptional regulator with XRE-family HTH domain
MSKIHPLRLWLIEHKMTARTFAAQLGVSGGAVSQWIHRQRSPGLEMAFRIQDATDGAVRARDMVAL